MPSPRLLIAILLILAVIGVDHNVEADQGVGPSPAFQGAESILHGGNKNGGSDSSPPGPSQSYGPSGSDSGK